MANGWTPERRRVGIGILCHIVNRRAPKQAQEALKEEVSNG